ncbi:hypothetical protein [Cupriavidus sp. AU9028]|uniref:hypothetical protein n=1 Tax=Cupriavidus sp. AU9028 TaxID=2871157 RepID=UPI001C9487A0|nr:hypothetical protein [Cupriavidus sp. AU9028]MBY4896095.1 hypothetical protein [Cupriavidus sp. AU9028]
MTASLIVELASPQQVNGTRAAFQSVWLLVRLYHAARCTPHRPQVHADDLRLRMSNARTLRMAIGRAFRDFEHWGLPVGWGDDAGRDPRFLNLEGRSQGPFWLPAPACDRIVCQVQGKPASEAEVVAFLGLDRHEPAATPLPAAQRLSAREDLAFWRHFIDGKQALREGRLLTPVAGSAGDPSALSALSAFRAARAVAANGFEHAFVALNEALLWRRLGDRSQTRRTLRALRLRRRHHAVPGNDYLDAMEQIVAAWCVYDERDLHGALARLHTLARTEPGATLVRVHPHVRFEWHNLAGLIHRSLALSAAIATDPASAPAGEANAPELAERAVEHFEQALAAASESNVADAAQHVAANLGMALWLFGQAGIRWSGAAPAGETGRAIQWIGMSEWLARGAGHRHPSAWNAIYLMRIARGDCPAAHRPPLQQFRRARPIGIAALRELAGPFADAFQGDAWPASWHQVAASRLAQSERGERKFPLLQQTSLLFELAWYAAHAGQVERAAQALARLRADLRQLPVSDRHYFGKALLDSLPAEVHALAEAVVGG